jgi:hypothetical protein
MAVDGSSTAVEFSVSSGEVVAIERILFTTVDNSKEDADGFFSIAALTKGMLIQVKEGAEILQHFGTDDIPIKRHADFNLLAGNDLVGEDAGGDGRFAIRWTIGRSGRRLLLSPPQKFVFIVQDNLSTFIEIRALAQGYRVRT